MPTPVFRHLPPRNRSRPGAVRWSAAFALLLFAGLLLTRALTVDHMVGAYTGCHECMIGPLLHHDAALWAFLSALLGLDLLSPWRWLSWVLRAAGCALVLVYALDLALFVTLTQRLYVADVLAFGGEGGAVGGFIGALLHTPNLWRWALSGLLLLAVCVTMLWPRRRHVRAGVVLLVVAAAGFALRAAPLASAHYVHPEIYDNVVEVNFDNAIDTPYSAATKASLKADPPSLAQSCTHNETSSRPDVILVAVESLSAYQSALLGGDMNALPKLDTIARANHYFTHFMANGFNTSGGRVALYTGRAPLPPPGWARSLPLAGYPYTTDTLPAYAHAAGYTANYFTTENLGFVHSAEWLKQLNFDSWEGSESPFYRGMKRWQFDAPADHELFARVLDWMDKRTDPKPFVAALLTVSSHPPFVNPLTGKIDKLGTFRYVDDQLDDFYQKLKARGFFKHGVLMITGDHRSMTPLHRKELERWGEMAFSRIPMVVAGDVDMPSVIGGLFAQTDTPTSIAWLIGAPVCTDAAHGIFTRAQPQSPGFVLHASGDQRNRVGVYYGDKRAALVLNGDDSTWKGDKPPQWLLIERLIAAQRIGSVEAAAKRYGEKTRH